MSIGAKAVLVGRQPYGARVQLRYTYRLTPAPGQCRALARAFGCARVVFNDAVAARQAAHEAGQPCPTDAELSKALITRSSGPRSGRGWPRCPPWCCSRRWRTLNTAYRNFFASVTGARKGRKAGRAAVPVPQGQPAGDPVHQERLGSRSPRRAAALPRIGDVPVRWSRDLPREASSVTVTWMRPGGTSPRSSSTSPTSRSRSRLARSGIDLGLTHFAVLSDGRKVDNPRFPRKAGAEAAPGAAGTGPQAEGLSANRTKSDPQGRKVHARVGGHPPGLAAQAVDHDRPREPSDRTWKTSPCRAWPGPGSPEVRARRGLVHVRRHARVQGCAARPDVREGRPVVPVHPDVLGVRGHRRGQAPARPRVDVHGAGPRTTGTSTPPGTSWPRDARTGQRSWSWCQPGPRSRNRP